MRTFLCILVQWGLNDQSDAKGSTSLTTKLVVCWFQAISCFVLFLIIFRRGVKGFKGDNKSCWLWACPPVVNLLFVRKLPAKEAKSCSSLPDYYDFACVFNECVPFEVCCANTVPTTNQSGELQGKQDDAWLQAECQEQFC